MTVVEAAYSGPWPLVEIGRVMKRVSEEGYPDLEPLSVFLEAGVVPRSSRSDNHNQLGADLAKYQRVLPGDLVFNKLRTWQGGFGASRHEGIVSPAYIILRPASEGMDARFVDYVLHSTGHLAELTRVSKFMPPSQFDIIWEDLRAVQIPLPPLDVQERIARFLDDQTTRIDQIISARQHQADLALLALDARWSAVFDDLRSRWKTTRLRRLVVSIADGPFGSALKSSDYADSGTRVIRLGNLGINDFKDADKVFISPQYARSLEQHRVVSGDVIMAGLGDEKWPLGRCAVVPQGFGEAINKADCYRIRVGPRVSPGYVSWAASSPQSRSALALLARGATRSRLNTQIAGDLPIPVPPADVQGRVVEEWQCLKRDLDQVAAAYERSTSQLAELKRSLVSAAVSGDFDVSTADGRRVVA